MGKSDNLTKIDSANVGHGLKMLLRRQAIALACLLLLICFVLGADHYRSAAILRTSKQVVGKAGKNINIPMTGGEICGTATAIGALPFNDSGTTVAVNDDYDLPTAFIEPTVTGCGLCIATGGGPPEAGPRGGVYLGTGTAADVAYSIEFSSAENSLNVTLTPTGGSDLALIVYTDVCSDLLTDAIVVDDDGGDGVAENVTISNMPAGTYHIVVDGYSTGGTPPGSSGPYTIAVTGSGVIATGPSISGTVTYGNAIGNPAPPRFVKTVSVASTVGSPAVGPVVTGTPGTYALTGFGAGSYTITPTKPSGPNGSITSNDAARVAQGVTGALAFVSNNQRFASDASGNGSLSSLDAAKIAQFVAGVPVVPPNFTGQWRFFISDLPAFPAGTHPQERTYASVTSNTTGEDYIGLLIGEASGNWNPASHPRPVGSKRLADGSIQKGIDVRLPQMAIPADKEIVIPVSIQGATDKDIISYEFDLRYDPSVIQPMGNPVDVAGTVSRGLFVVANPYEPGLLRVVLYGPMPIDEDGILLNLRFTAVGADGAVSPLTFERILFNDFDAIDAITNGEIKLSTTHK